MRSATRIVTAAYEQDADRSRADRIKSKMRLSQSLRYGPPRSTSANRQLCVDLPTLNGLRVFNVGTNERSSTARIILQPHAFSPKPGAKFFGDQRATLILAVLSDKDLRGICEALAPISDYVLLPKIRSARAAAPEELAKVLSDTAPSLPYSITPSIADALNLARAETASDSDHRLTPFRRRSSRAFARRTRRLRRMRAMSRTNTESGERARLACWRTRPRDREHLFVSNQ